MLRGICVRMGGPSRQPGRRTNTTGRSCFCSDQKVDEVISTFEKYANLARLVDELVRYTRRRADEMLELASTAKDAPRVADAESKVTLMVTELQAVFALLTRNNQHCDDVMKNLRG
jgi:hypothetical protein